jgi:thiol-disulfide isomerase/thioredoxin
MNRRQTMAVGAAAAVAGVLWGVYRPGGLGTAVSAGDAASMWDLTFESPQGPPLVMRRFQGQRLLVNFWATWCPPCVEELPLLDAFYQQQRARGWQVVGLAVDSLASVQTFLAHHPVSFPIGLAAGSGVALSRSLGNTVGGLPFTAVFVGQDQAVIRKSGLVSAQDLADWAQR